MNKKVCVRVRGLHSIESDMDDETVEVINIGSYFKRNGKHYVKYEELLVENDSTVNNTLLKISENEVEIISKGITSSHMIFTRGRKNVSFYNTPFGGLNIGVDTYDLNADIKENLIVVDLEYGLEVNLGFVSDCSVHIEIESIEE